MSYSVKTGSGAQESFLSGPKKNESLVRSHPTDISSYAYEKKGACEFEDGESVGDFLLKVCSPEQEQKRTAKGETIIRNLYINRISKSLSWLAENHENYMDSLAHITRLLEDLSEYKDKYFNHVFASYVFGLYSSLAFENYWKEVSKEQYGQIYRLISSFGGYKNVRYEDVDKGLKKLESAGLDVTPF